jgi:hypothetical protein
MVRFKELEDCSNDCLDAHIDGYVNDVSGKRWNKLDILNIFIYLCC